MFKSLIFALLESLRS